MGVERAVTRWHVRRQSILNEISALEAQLADLARPRYDAGSTPGEELSLAKTRLSRQLEQAREKLRELGPCPQPMMG